MEVLLLLIQRERGAEFVIKKSFSNVLYTQVKLFTDSSLYSGAVDVSDYDAEIRKDRILLAHYPESTSTHSSMEIKKDDGSTIIYDELKFIELRKNIQKYKKLLKKLGTAYK